MNFTYTKYLVEPTPTIPDGIIHRPQVFLRIAGSKSDLFLLALVDTGADETIIPLSVADEIGIELDANKRSQASGVTGQPLELLPGRVELEILGESEAYRWSDTISFARFADEEDECAILGHAGALRYFTATFDGERNQGSLLPNGTMPNL
jgi:hypothetical protein